MPALGEQVRQYLRAGFTGLWVETYEFGDAIAEIVPVCAERQWPVIVWDFAAGLKCPRDTAEALRDFISKNTNYQMKPLPLVQDMPVMSLALRQAQESQGSEGATHAIWILKNFHHQQLVHNLPIMQALQNAVTDCKAEGQVSCCAIVLSPMIEIPRELEKDFVILEHELPGKEQLWSIAKNICAETELPKTDDDKRLVLDAAAGLSRRGFEDALSLSLAKTGKLDPNEIWDLKAQDLKKRGVLEIYKGTDTYAQLGGLQQFKEFSKQLLRRRDNPLLQPRGMLLLGVPGAGKSAIIKAMGNETQRKVLMMDMGALRSKFQGETDANVRMALKLADAMQPCILFVD